MVLTGRSGIGRSPSCVLRPPGLRACACVLVIARPIGHRGRLAAVSALTAGKPIGFMPPDRPESRVIGRPAPHGAPGRQTGCFGEHGEDVEKDAPRRARRRTLGGPLLLGVAAHAQAPSRPKDDLVIGVAQFPSSLHPDVDAEVIKAYVNDFVIRPITAFDPDWKNTCLLCTELPTRRERPRQDRGRGRAAARAWRSRSS